MQTKKPEKKKRNRKSKMLFCLLMTVVWCFFFFSSTWYLDTINVYRWCFFRNFISDPFVPFLLINECNPLENFSIEYISHFFILRQKIPFVSIHYILLTTACQFIFLLLFIFLPKYHFLVKFWQLKAFFWCFILYSGKFIQYFCQIFQDRLLKRNQKILEGLI